MQSSFYCNLNLLVRVPKGLQGAPTARQYTIEAIENLLTNIGLAKGVLLDWEFTDPVKEPYEVSVDENYREGIWW